jgi:hypothetical protein
MLQYRRGSSILRCHGSSCSHHAGLVGKLSNCARISYRSRFCRWDIISGAVDTRRDEEIPELKVWTLSRQKKRLVLILLIRLFTRNVICEWHTLSTNCRVDEREKKLVNPEDRFMANSTRADTLGFRCTLTIRQDSKTSTTTFRKFKDSEKNPKK